MTIPDSAHFRRTKAGALAWVEPEQVVDHIAKHGKEPDAPMDQGHSALMACQAIQEVCKGHEVVHAMHVPGMGWVDFVKSRSTP